MSEHALPAVSQAGSSHLRTRGLFSSNTIARVEDDNADATPVCTTTTEQRQLLQTCLDQLCICMPLYALHHPMPDKMAMRGSGSAPPAWNPAHLVIEPHDSIDASPLEVLPVVLGLLGFEAAVVACGALGAREGQKLACRRA